MKARGLRRERKVRTGEGEITQLEDEKELAKIIERKRGYGDTTSRMHSS